MLNQFSKYYTCTLYKTALQSFKACSFSFEEGVVCVQRACNNGMRKSIDPVKMINLYYMGKFHIRRFTNI